MIGWYLNGCVMNTFTPLLGSECENVKLDDTPYWNYTLMALDHFLPVAL